MTPQAIPDAPEPTPCLSRTRMSPPPPRPRALSSLARCQAVESPWIPAPMMMYRLLVGMEVTGPASPGGEPDSIAYTAILFPNLGEVYRGTDWPASHPPGRCGPARDRH